MQKFHNGYSNVRKKNGLFNYGAKDVETIAYETSDDILADMHDCAEKSFTVLNIHRINKKWSTFPGHSLILFLWVIFSLFETGDKYIPFLMHRLQYLLFVTIFGCVVISML